MQRYLLADLHCMVHAILCTHWRYCLYHVIHHKS